MPSPALFESIAAVLGLVLGSFLNVCISRLPRRESIVSPRSHCPKCGRIIRWYDNIPLLSFVLLRARCRGCGEAISWRYPAVELAVALWTVLAAMRLYGIHYVLAIDNWALVPEETVKAIAIYVLGFLLIGLMVMDWETQRLPDAFTFTGIALGFLFACTQAMFLQTGEGDIVLSTTHQLRLSSPGSFASRGNVFLTGSEALVFGRIVAIAVAAILLLGIRAAYRRVRNRQGMGLGDVKLLAMIAAFLGLAQSFFALFLGVIAAAIYGVILIARRRADLSSRLPFGSFLCAGGLIAALSGPEVLAWYSSLFR